MLRWLVLVLAGATLCGARLRVGIKIVQKDVKVVTSDKIMKNFRSLELPVDSMSHVELRDLNATLLWSQCEAGYYWEDPRCLPCACPLPVPTAPAGVWFEPLLEVAAVTDVFR
jgi:hypothetical protein